MPTLRVDVRITPPIAGSGSFTKLENLIFKSTRVDGVCSNLWRLDLIPDNQAIDRSMAGVRLSRNQELVYRIRPVDGRDAGEIERAIGVFAR